jgi:hypothetical protein
MRPSIACLTLALALPACDPLARLFGAPDRPAPPSVPAPAAQPAPTPQTVSVPVAARCEATPRGSFHLRPTEQVEAAGPELAAGTRLEVLARAGVARRRGELFRVRVIDSGATGYAFLTLGDLGGACPFAWEAPVPATPPVTADGCLARAGWFPTREESLVERARGLAFRTEWRADLGHDGGAAELAVLESLEGCIGEGLYVLLLHGPRGWRALELGAETAGEHHGRGVQRVETPRGALILTSDSEQFEGDGEPVRNATYTLHRVTAEGALAAVWSATNAGLTPEDWTFTAGHDDTVVVASPGAHRQQVLAWNTPRTALATRR